MAQLKTNRASGSPQVVSFYRNSVSVIGLLLWVVLVIIFPFPTGSAWAVITTVSFFLAFSYTFPIEIYNTPIGITHLIFLGTGILYGPSIAIWSALIGIGFGSLSRLVFRTYPHQSTTQPLTTLSNSLFDLSLQMLPFVFSNAIVNWQEAPIELNPMLQYHGDLHPRPRGFRLPGSMDQSFYHPAVHPPDLADPDHH